MPICSSIKPNGAPAGGLVATANFSQCAAVAECWNSILSTGRYGSEIRFDSEVEQPVRAKRGPGERD